MTKLPDSCRLVQQFLNENGVDSRVQVLSVNTATALEAAIAMGCTAAQIVKSIIFRAKKSGRPVLVLTCGDNRVDVKKVAALIGEKVIRADTDFVIAQSGFEVGGVAPFAHRQPPLVVIDVMVRRFERMWAAAGTSNSMVCIETAALIRLAGGVLADIAVTVPAGQ